MTTYVALIRGIMPMNPNMKGENLKRVFESLGFSDVETVIASGNVVFKTASKSDALLETRIEDALEDQLGFKRSVIVRRKEELERLIKKDPFKGVKDEKPNYLVVTFLKDRMPEICTVLDTSKKDTTDFMRIKEKQYGKEITTRTWKTVGRILKKMNPS